MIERTSRGCRPPPRAAIAVAGLIALAPAAASAGPPFLTDDPAPTDTGHWEIYTPQLDAAGRGRDYEGSFGAEINYGAAPNLQLSIGLPVSYAHDGTGLKYGRGDMEVGAKYRFYQNHAAGISIAAFPSLSLPTASHGMGNRRVTTFLPVWAQRDAGPWSVFGGGGYAFNPGAGARDYWAGGLALTRQISKAFLAGVEMDRQGSDTIGGRATTSLGLGVILQLKPPFSLLASAGPTFTDGEAQAGVHAFMALGLNF